MCYRLRKFPDQPTRCRDGLRTWVSHQGTGCDELYQPGKSTKVFTTRSVHKLVVERLDKAHWSRNEWLSRVLVSETNGTIRTKRLISNGKEFQSTDCDKRGKVTAITSKEFDMTLTSPLEVWKLIFDLHSLPVKSYKPPYKSNFILPQVLSNDSFYQTLARLSLCWTQRLRVLHYLLNVAERSACAKPE